MTMFEQMEFRPIVVDMVAYLNERGEDVSKMTVRPKLVILELDHERLDDKADYVSVAREVIYVGHKTMSHAEAVDYLDERHPAPGGKSWGVLFGWAGFAALERDSRPAPLALAA